MLFNSLAFGVLLVVVLIAARWTRGRVKTWVLLLASWAFYAGWEPKWLLLLWASTAVDYVAGRMLERTEHEGQRKLWLAASLVVNLGLLYVFKYWDFSLALIGIGSLSAVADSGFHVYGDIPPGLSFYTFQTLSYTIDVYRRKQKAVRDPVDFALFVAFFPQLVAGPIVRASEFFPQLANPPVPSTRRTLIAIEIFAVGLFKKVVIADNLGMMVDQVFRNVGHQSAAALLVAGFLFWGQVYADFSGYSTMARGLGKGLGFELPKNFNFPLLASGPLQYRRGWHVTMSTWFRDYVFHPLGGTRVGPWRAALNVMIVWTLFGVWHGAGLTFAMWGFYNGAIQVLVREYYRRFGAPPDFRGKAFAGWLLNLWVVVPAMMFFRSPNLDAAWQAITRIYTWAPGRLPSKEAVALLLGLTLVHYLSKRYYREDLLPRLSWPLRIGLIVGIVWAMVWFAAETRPFIYFQF